MDAPRFVTVFCTPPTSPLWESGTAETVTAPSCEARVPIPSPARRSGPVTMSAPAPESSAARSTTMPRNNRPNPTRTIRRGERVREEPRDADGTGQQRDRERKEPHPGGDGREPEGHRQEEGDHEEQAGLQHELEEERRQPTLQAGHREHPGVEQRGPVVLQPPALPQREQRQDDAAPEQQPDDGGHAEPLWRVGLGLDEAPGAGPDDAVDDHAEARGGQQRADRIEAHAGDRPASRPSGASGRGCRAP